MAVIGAEWNGSIAFLLLFEELNHYGIHIGVAREVIRLGEASVGFMNRVSQVHKSDVWGEFGCHGGHVVIRSCS